MKRVLSLSIGILFAAYAAHAVAAPANKYSSNQAQFATQGNKQVRDHRTGAEPVVRDHRTPKAPAGVKQPTTSTGPIIRDHRTPKAPPLVSTGPIIRDHRSPDPIIRDHRSPDPIIRDHRKPTGPFKPPVVDPVKPPKPWKPPVGPIKPPPVADPMRPPKGPVKPPVDPVKPPKGPVKPPAPPQDPPQNPPHDDHGHGHGHGHKHDFPWWNLLGGVGGGRYPYPYPYNYGRGVSQPVIIVNQAPAEEAPLELSPGMELTVTGAGFGSTPGQAEVQLGELLLAVDVVRWQADAVVVRLPMAQIARWVKAELLVTRADGSLARVIPFDLVPGVN